jgi:adenosylmethionine-8-amino-7-oxononanoate aminotransferase
LGPESVTAIVVEPILGNGMQALTSNDLQTLSLYCRTHGIHLVADEVATGWGRVGVWSRCVELGVIPDMLVLGKGLTSGYAPCSALVVSEALSAIFADPVLGMGFPLGSTSDGHPLAMAAGLAVVAALECGVLARVRPVGDYLHGQLSGISHPAIGTVSGLGLMLGLRLWDKQHPWSPSCMERLRLMLERIGVLVHTVGNCVAVVPPLVIEETECDEIARALGAALHEVS